MSKDRIDQMVGLAVYELCIVPHTKEEKEFAFEVTKEYLKRRIKERKQKHE